MGVLPLKTEQLLETQQILSKTSNLLVINSLGATLSHELNTPLQASLTFIQSTMRRLKKSSNNLEVEIESLEGAASAIGNVNEIISRVRSVTKSSDFEKSKCSLNDGIETALNFLKPELNGNSIQIVCSELSNLPYVSIKHSELVQVFVNILKNSIDELSDKVDKVISIEAGLENGQFVMINICDTGNGIQEKQLDDLFNLSKSKKEQGLGIGMWLTKNILENAGGDVYYADHTNGGARFEIRLPVFDE